MNLKLETEKLREILIHFYNISKTRTVIFDSDFQKIVAYPEESCAFCAMLKENGEARALCRENDERACEECKKSDRLLIYKCHAGLFEAVAPIKMNDLTLGYIMLGQIKERGYDDGALVRYAERFSSDTERITRACRRLHQRSEEQITSLASVMELCTCYLWIAKLISIDEENIVYHLSSYIADNLAGDLSVEALTALFHVSRSRLYEISHKHFGMSIAKYIKKKRVSVAAEALSRGAGIAEAAERAGFTDYNYFSKVFKSETGVTPGKYKAASL